MKEVLERAEKHALSWPLERDMSDGDLQELLYPEKHEVGKIQRKPDCEYIHKELAKSGVTLSLLWDEYSLNCRQNNEIPYSYRQFCRFYHAYATKTKATMRIKRKPGELMEVDWAGQTMVIKDHLTDEDIPAYVFVSALPCSQYAYVEAFLSMDTESWITAHINAFKFYGGVARITVPDNLKTGVVQPSRTEPILNRTYQEMAEHYQTTIIPARVSRPKDKPSAEGTVGIISTWIIASLRHQQFFSIQEMNKAIQEKLTEFNTKPFQKKEGNRLTAFLDEEKFALLPLPNSPYELAQWKKATVQYDYHIHLDKMLYSVPYDYIKYQVDVRVTRHVIEIFYKHLRIASHKRLHGKEGQHATNPEHMPRDHKQYISFNKESVLEWAASAGTHILKTAESILAAYRTEQQALKSCLGLMKLADKHSIARVEKACERALGYTSTNTKKHTDNPENGSGQASANRKQDTNQFRKLPRVYSRCCLLRREKP